MRCRLVLSVAGVLVFSSLTTISTLVLMASRFSFSTRQTSDGWQLQQTDEWLIDFAVNADLLVSQLEEQEARLPTANESTSIREEIAALRHRILQMKRRVDDRAVRVLLSKPIINHYDFNYTRNPVETCTRSPTRVLIVVPSAAGNFQKRADIRNGERIDYLLNGKNQAKMLFFLGRPKWNVTAIQKKIDQEDRQYGDIVQSDFLEVYRNMRLKSVSILKWVTSFCPGTTYVIRCDDDITIDIGLIVSALYQTSRILDNFILGQKRARSSPIRDPRSKYFVSEAEYPAADFPPYLLGGVLGLPVKTVTLLYQAALRVPPLWLDDVYLTGLCAPQVHAAILRHPNFAFDHNYKNS